MTSIDIWLTNWKRRSSMFFMVIWFIGLSGSGKSTVSRHLYETLNPEIPNLVWIDGDVVREVFGNDVDHTVEGRRKNAERISRLCKMLSDQGIHVIAAVLSIFPDWQDWNRRHLADYAQIYIKVPMNVLKRRHKKNLYGSAEAGLVKNVVGVDISFPEPLGSELVLDNGPDRTDFRPIIDEIIKLPQILKIMKK